MLRPSLEAFYLGKSASTFHGNFLIDFNPETHINHEPHPEKLKVFVTTWNMGNAEAENLQGLFSGYIIGSNGQVKTEYDLIVIGLQESTYTSKNTTDCLAHLQNEFLRLLGSKYDKVEHCHRAQLQLYIFAKKSLQIDDIQISIENTGFLHVFPNKGGLLVTFSIQDIKFAFISSHLTAHEGAKNCAHRNASVAEILGGARTNDKRFDVTNQCHYVFWMGDLNYRITFDPETPMNTKKNILQAQEQKKQQAISEKEVNFNIEGVEVMEGMDDDSESCSDEETAVDDGHLTSKSPKSARTEQWKRVIDMINMRQWTELLAYDELNREIKAGRVFNGFVALQPTFPPTFKRTRQLVIDLPPLLSNSSHKEILSDLESYYHPKRIPSYTDRILYKTMPTCRSAIKTVFFESCEDVTSSDHKPVRAGFEIGLVPNGYEDIFVDRNLLPKKHKYEQDSKDAVLPKGAILKSLHLKVTELQGYDLEEMDSQMFGGKSDPYIIIYSDPMPLLLEDGKKMNFNAQYGVKSKVIKHNINPTWKETLDVHIGSLDLQGLSNNASLQFTVWDEDFSNYDDLIGAFSIPLKDILTSYFIKHEEFYQINSFLFCNSEIMGRITGKIFIDGHAEDILRACKSVANDRKHNNDDMTLSVNYFNLRGFQIEMERTQKQDSAQCCTIQ